LAWPSLFLVRLYYRKTEDNFLMKKVGVEGVVFFSYIKIGRQASWEFG